MFKLQFRIKWNDLEKMWPQPSDGSLDTGKIQIFGQPFHRSMSTKIMRNPDGFSEKHQIITDSQGNREEKITKQIGTKVHTTIIKTAKDGSQVKTEESYNIDMNEV